ncbi:alpha/beta hydrolase [Flavobacterium sp. SM15]|uniref:alpha/beta hydrolase n=1 Tax=Flavobacterium sp. SM15 TaxID=2908005 RepID=UPI001ED9E6A0|nr:alpha/beta hydrolase [Flavobacterium sp. SM15]MCG2611557.1 alpha/beta hydrolase [Flavobacterium sp. SM15]
MRKIVSLLLLLLSFIVTAQKSAEDFGFQHLKLEYKKQVVDILIQTKKGEETKKKPIFFWCQGSLPQPVIKYDEKGIYGTFPFNPDDFLNEFHLVIVGKPGVPVISEVSKLNQNYTYTDESGKTPDNYNNNNFPDYYVNRNNWIIGKLIKLPMFSDKKLVVSGHSEGSSIAAKMASENTKITHLIYSGGNPYGRIMSILAQSRYYDSDNNTIEYWKEVVENKNDLITEEGDSFKTTYDFSVPVSEKLEKIKIPVLITYGTKDWNAAYNDLFYVEAIRKQLKNITFIPMIGLEHNYFPVNEKMEPNHAVYNWEDVGKQWAKWLTNN